MTRIIDKNEALDLLEKAVESRGGDYVYPAQDLAVYFNGKRTLRKYLTPEQLRAVDIDPENPKDRRGSCVYFDGDQPLCIVGQVFSQVGIGVGDIERSAGDQYGVVTALLRYGSKKLAGIEFTEDATTVLSEAQRIQDGGNTWGQALIKAKARLA